MNNLPWFRMYSESVDDEKLRLLAFEDRWHFVALLCCKGQGVIRQDDPLMRRKIAVKLGLDLRAFEEAMRRLSEVGLIDFETLEPMAWDSRQMQSDSSAARVAAYRERKKQEAKRDGNVTVTAQELDTDKDIDKEEEIKNKQTPVQARAKKSSPVSSGLDFSSWPTTPSDSVWRDYKKLRDQKKAPISQTVINRLGDEMHKAAVMGFSVDDFLSECVLRGWQGGKAEWLQNQAQQGNRPQTNADRNADWNEKMNRVIAESLGTAEPTIKDMGTIDATF